MSSINGSELPPPSDWDAFEEMCADLFEQIWNDQNTMRCGRRGQRQNGVDIYGRPDGNLYVGVQCKGKRRWPPIDLTTDEIDKEVSKALKFTPKLNEFVIATTALNDVKAQNHVRAITEQHEKNGLFSVHVYSWGELARRITLYGDLVEKHFGYIGIGHLKSQIDELPKIIHELSAQNLPVELIDREIERQLNLLRKSRFFEGFDPFTAASDLAERITKRDLQAGTQKQKSQAVSWCARILANKDTEKADILLRAIENENTSTEYEIAQAFVVTAKGQWQDALDQISGLDTPLTKSAAFLVVGNGNGFSEAFDWMDKVGYECSELDSDGKFVFITRSFETKNWNGALDAANTVNETDYQTTPALYFAVAMANLVQAVPVEYRILVMREIPFEMNRFPIETTTQSLEFIRTARSLFEQCENEANELNLKMTANIASDYALWLELSDPKNFDKGRERIKESMSDERHSLRRVNFALQFGIELDFETVERQIERTTALTGGKSVDAALARLALAFTQESPKGVADYIDSHRVQLREHIEPLSFGTLEIEMLSQAGQFQDARARLDDLAGNKDIDQHTILRLEQLIEGASINNPVKAKLVAYEDDPSLQNLNKLIAALEEQKDWEQMFRYATDYFSRVKSVGAAKTIAQALNEQNKYDDIYLLLEANPEFIEQSTFLKSLWCVALYYRGDVIQASSVLTELRSERDQANFRELEVNIAITSGNWESLSQHIEAEWKCHSDRSSKELLDLARLAHSLRSGRVRGFLQEAVSKAETDPDILLNAYGIAIGEGWDCDKEVIDWFHNAIRYSGENGPVKTMSFQEISERQPVWEEYEQGIWKQLKNSEIPIFGAAMSLNRTLCDLFLLPAIANQEEDDTRRRSNIYAFSAVREVEEIEIQRIGFDLTALLSLSVLDLVDTVINNFKEVIIPHSTLGWLFEEKQRISFHQPRRVKDALELRDMLQNGKLYSFISTAKVDPDLAVEIGGGLAALISEAVYQECEGDGQHFVIRSAPVHLAGSLMDKTANLENYKSVLCSCMGVIEKLQSSGQLTSSEVERAKAYLEANEKRWPEEPEIPDDAILYLDDLSVSYLQHVKVLGKLKAAGLTVYISSHETKEIRALLNYDTLADDAEKAIEKLRVSLAKGIQSGNVRLGPLPSSGDQKYDRFRLHPTISILDIVSMVDAVCVDDRYLNKHRKLDASDRQTPIVATVDIIDYLLSKDVIDIQMRQSLRTKLRQAGYMFVPVKRDELHEHLSQASVVNGKLQETAELKAIRENILQIRMFGVLRLPHEFSWLFDMQDVVISVLQRQWKPEMDENFSQARSNWLLKFLDLGGWSPCVDTANRGTGFGEIGRFKRAQGLMSFMNGVTNDTMRQYWNWLEGTVLEPLKNDNPAIYEKLIESCEQTVIEQVEPVPESLANDSE